MSKKLRRWLSRDRSLLEIPANAAMAAADGRTRLIVAVRYRASFPRSLYYPPWDFVSVHLDGEFADTTASGRKVIVRDVRSGHHVIEVRGGDNADELLASVNVEAASGEATYVAIAPPKGPRFPGRRPGHRILVAQGARATLMSQRVSLIRRYHRLNEDAMVYFGSGGRTAAQIDTEATPDFVQRVVVTAIPPRANRILRTRLSALVLAPSEPSRSPADSSYDGPFTDFELVGPFVPGTELVIRCEWRIGAQDWFPFRYRIGPESSDVLRIRFEPRPILGFIFGRPHHVVVSEKPETS